MSILEKTDKVLWSSDKASYQDYEWLEDLRANLNFELPREILIYADLGLWNGRRTGYKEITSGKLSDCLYSDYDPTWYVDEDMDLRCIDVHHDGTNYYLYRTYKPNIDEYLIEELKQEIYEGTATEEQVMALTDPIGPYIAEVYPWVKGE